MMGIVRAADGWLGINCLTGQHWLDVCAMVGLPEYGEHQIAIMLGGPERDEFFAKAQPWLATNGGRYRRAEPGDANSGGPGQRRGLHPGLSAIWRARDSSWARGDDWSFRGRARRSVVQDTGSPSATRASLGATPRALRDAIWRRAGARARSLACRSRTSRFLT